MRRGFFESALTATNYQILLGNIYQTKTTTNTTIVV